ncbi:hypothetical protein AZE42_08194 [Rhizopogon vesiculosus]|uniref:Uncharacterized protein n=1 Tax=Rhizopogon vesiculosus TaxID=180088 RepID=A0A1J8QGD1_9AGAM|nr:hypothetical protein AZE42_08194 [Rhizopogon vesiculosus]
MAAYVITLVQHSEFPSLKRFLFALQSEALSCAEVEQLFCALSRAKHAKPSNTLPFPPTFQPFKTTQLTLSQQSDACFVSGSYKPFMSLFAALSVLTMTFFWKLCQVGRTSAVWS